VQEQKALIIENALNLLLQSGSERLFLFLTSKTDCQWLLQGTFPAKDQIVAVVPREMDIRDATFRKAGVGVIRSWAGNQSRFSRIKYAFMHGVMHGVITPASRVVCALGPWSSAHLDTVTVHDLSSSWTEEFPFDPRSLIARESFNIIMAVVDIALDIGALGREGKPVGTTLVIGDKKELLKNSHQAVFNPFRGYPLKDRMINRTEVVESIKELAQLDGAFIITTTGAVEAAGRHLNASSPITKALRGLGSRHRAAAGISRKTDSVAIVVSESTGRVTIFEQGRIISTLEPVISTRLA
jgi:hypothetical protein